MVWRLYRKPSLATGHFYEGIPIPRVMVSISYGSYRSGGCRYEKPAELTEHVGNGYYLGKYPRG